MVIKQVSRSLKLKIYPVQKFNPIKKIEFTQGYFEEIKKNEQLFIDSKGVKYPVLKNETYKRSQQYFIKIIK